MQMSEEKNFSKLPIDWKKASKELTAEDFSKDFDAANLYTKELKEAIDWTNQYRESTGNTGHKKRCCCCDSYEYSSKKINNIYSVVGDRGTGKSSFLAALKVSIKKEDGECGNCDEPPKHKRHLYYLPTVDPSVFNDKIHVIELFVSALANEVDKCKKECVEDHFNQIKAEFYNSLRKVFDNLVNMRKEKSVLIDQKSNMEILSTFQNQAEMFDKIESLIEKFLNVMNDRCDKNYSHVVLQIDDLDLVSNKIIYETLQSIFKFLKGQNNLIIFIAYREEQLFNSVLNHLLEENERLLNTDCHSEKLIDCRELKDQVSNYLEKGLPKPDRSYLSVNAETDIYKVLRPFVIKKNDEDIDDVLNQYLDSENKNIRDFIAFEVKKKTRLQILPIDESEDIGRIIPNTLRNILQYAEMIYKMDNYEEEINKNESSKYILETLKYNVQSYRSFILSLFETRMPNELYSILDEWLNRRNSSKNGYVVNKFLGLIDFDTTNSESLKTHLKSLRNKQMYNVSLGDVYSIIDSYLNINKEEDEKVYFVYALKVLYSIESLLAYIKTMEVYLSAPDFENKIYKSCLKEYMDLVRGKIMPDRFVYSKGVESGTSVEIKFQMLPERFFEKMVISDIAAKGEIIKNFDVSTDYTDPSNPFKYRYQFSKNKNKWKNRKVHLQIDPYAFVTDKTMIEETVKKSYLVLTNKNKLENANASSDSLYVFYSMFDLDAFVRMNYSRNSDNGRFSYVIRKINNIITGHLRTTEEIDMYTKMSWPLFSMNRSYKQPFLLGEIKDFTDQYYPSDTTIINKFRYNYKKMGIDHVRITDIRNFFNSYANKYGDDFPPEFEEADEVRFNQIIEDSDTRKRNQDKVIIDKIIDYIAK